MIRLNRPLDSDILDEDVRSYLAKRQKSADSYAPRTSKIDLTWSAFLKTKKRWKVSGALDSFSFAKCAYCEQENATDIEHFYPKSDYPDRMFRWSNLLRACKNCNNAKQAIFPLDGERPVLIDPTNEEPLDYFGWDETTGITILNPDQPMHKRAQTTRDLFRLDQESLCEERRYKLSIAKYLMRQVKDENPVTQRTREQICNHLHHGRPWLGIVRQWFQDPGPHAELVAAARAKPSEIDEWTAGWL